LDRAANRFDCLGMVIEICCRVMYCFWHVLRLRFREPMEDRETASGDYVLIHFHLLPLTTD
jgi:hypothetical protein